MAGERSYFSKESVVRGHHVYKHIWTPGIGEELSVEKEPGNLHDSFAVSMVKNDSVAQLKPAPAQATRPRRLFENRRLLLYRTCDPRR